MIEKFKCLISNLDVKICKYSDRGCQNTDTTFIDEHPRGGGRGVEWEVGREEGVEIEVGRASSE